MKMLTRMDMVVIKDYDHVTTMGDNVNWMKLTHLLSSFFSKAKLGPFIHLPLFRIVS